VAAVTTEMLTQHPDITALVAPQDAAVPGILKAITARGLSIPEDISVVGLLDESFAEVMTPPLTALSFSSRTLGFTAAEMLVARLSGDETRPQQILVRPELCVRGSTGPARTND
jgi:LacI family transcriptional regulator